MMAIDVLACLINQKSLIEIFDRLSEVDDKFLKENISLNYRIIKKYSIILLVVAAVGEFSLGCINVYVFSEEFFSWSSLYWLISCLPLFNNSIAKIWFLILILLVRQRLRAINNHLNDLKNIFLEKKRRQVTVDPSSSKKDNLFMESIGFLEKEIFSSRKIRSDKAWKWDGDSITANQVNDVNIFQPKSKGIVNVTPYDSKGESIDVD